MKHLLLFVFLLSYAGVYAQSFGEKIKSKESSALEARELMSPTNQKAEKLLITGEVESVCQVKGCWMKIITDDGETVRVTFKDYGFFVPKDLSGKRILMEGKPEVKVTSVDELKHYAEDAGKSAEEIANITESKREVTFVATGVKIQQQNKGGSY